MTTAQNAPWIPEVIANESLGLLGSYLNLGKTVATDSDIGAVQEGQTINIPRRGVITAQQKTQGTDASAQRPAADDIQIVVDQHWYVRLLEEDFTRAVQRGSVLPGYVEDAVIVLAEKIETKLALLSDGFDNIDFTSGGSDTAAKALGRVRTRMIQNKIPQLATLYGYVDPTFSQALAEENAFLDPKLLQNLPALVDGVVGKAKGFYLFEGQLVQHKGSPAWAQNIFYTKNAMVLASRPLQSPDRSLGVDATVVQSEAGLALRLIRHYDSKAMGVVVQLDTLFGAGVNDARQGFVLESK